MAHKTSTKTPTRDRTVTLKSGQTLTGSAAQSYGQNAPAFTRSVPATPSLPSGMEFGAAGRGELSLDASNKFLRSAGGGGTGLPTQRQGESNTDFATRLRNAPFALAGGDFSGPLTTSSLSSSGSINLPSPSFTDYSGGGASAYSSTKNLKDLEEDLYDTETGQRLVDPRQDQGLNNVRSLLQQFGLDERPRSVLDDPEYRSALRQQQETANVVDDYTSQLKAIEAKATADQLSLEGQGRGIPEVIIGGQQAKINREAAIKALPVAALLESAQGRAQSAQSHLDTMYKLISDEIDNDRQYRKDVFSAVAPFMDRAEQRRLAVRDRDEDRADEEKKALEAAKHAARSAALENRAPQTVMNAINGAQTIEAVQMAAGIYGTDMLGREYQQAQIASANRANRPEGDSLLSVTEAQALGVPYGTTKLQAMGKGITPTKPSTAVQDTTALYANRLEQSNAIISKLDSYAVNANPYLFAAQQRTPEFLTALKSGNFQSLEQAQRNFINAVLRRESGAVISPEEFDNARQQYFPVPGNTPQVVVQKKENRDLVQQGFIQGAGSAYMPIATPTSSVTKSGKVFDAVAAKAAGYTEEEIRAYLATH